MNSGKIVRRITSAAAIAASVVAIPAFSAPASAAVTHIDCGSAHSKEIGHETLFESSPKHVYGMAAWRYGTSGRCKGYKWVNIYVTHAFQSDSPPDSGLWVSVYADNRQRLPITTRHWDSQWVHSGTYHSYALYGYHHSLAAGAASFNTTGWVELGSNNHFRD